MSKQFSLAILLLLMIPCGLFAVYLRSSFVVPEFDWVKLNSEQLDENILKGVNTLVCYRAEWNLDYQGFSKILDSKEFKKKAGRRKFKGMILEDSKDIPKSSFYVFVERQRPFVLVFRKNIKDPIYVKMELGRCEEFKERLFKELSGE